MFDLDTINGLFGDAVTVADGRVTVSRPAVLAGPPMDQLVRAAVFADGVEREYARWLIWELGQTVGVQPASIRAQSWREGRRRPEQRVVGGRVAETSRAIELDRRVGQEHGWRGPSPADGLQQLLGIRDDVLDVAGDRVGIGIAHRACAARVSVSFDDSRLAMAYAGARRSAGGP